MIHIKNDVQGGPIKCFLLNSFWRTVQRPHLLYPGKSFFQPKNDFHTAQHESNRKIPTKRGCQCGCHAPNKIANRTKSRDPNAGTNPRWWCKITAKKHKKPDTKICATMVNGILAKEKKITPHTAANPGICQKFASANCRSFCAKRPFVRGRRSTS